MTRDDAHAKGAKEHRETNYERYFSTPEKAAAQVARSSFLDCDYCKDKPECVTLIDRGESQKITKKMCLECALDWLNAPAEPR